MEIPGLGPIVDQDGTLYSEPVPVNFFECEMAFIVEGYEDDPSPEDFHAAVEAFLALDQSALEAASVPVYEYYKEMRDFGPGEVPDIAGPEHVWDYVQPGFEAVLTRDDSGDRQVCVSVECNCDWEPEHGLQVVFRGGRVISKVGQYDGHLSNSSASGCEVAPDVVYLSFSID
jgi:hypothetical protein